MGTMEYPKGATPLDSDEMEGLKFKHVTTREELDHLEQANIEKGLRWLSRHKNPDVLSERFVRELHKKLLGEVWKWAGTFRKTEKNIGIDPTQISVQLRVLMDDARFWVENATYTPVEIAARFHHRLVYIHCFPNGNGRHARIMADEVLMKLLGKEPIDWSAGYQLQTMNQRRDEYILTLRAADVGDYGPLLAFVGADSRE
jgi:Fic-DOC domain mobile mystery protein B